MNRPSRTFKSQLAALQPMIGTFVKTPAPHVVEVLGEAGLDFVIIDQEHAPFDKGSVDLALLAAHAQALTALVRVSDLTGVLPALDAGADGVVIPHVSSPEVAKAAVSACRYSTGSRGFSNSPRAARYGSVILADHVAAQDELVSCILQIEDTAAVDAIEPILEVPGISALFIGCADLAVSLGEAAPDALAVRTCAARICSAAARAKISVLAPAISISQAQWLLDLGVSTLVVGSDQSLMRLAAAALRDEFRACRRSPKRSSW